jgi:hypothetical protein
MAELLFPRSGTLLEERTLRRVGAANSPLNQYLRRFASHSKRYFRDDFEGDTINLDNYALGNGGGASSVAFAANVQEGGAILATTGTANDATASESLIMPLTWYGDRFAGMEVLFKPSALTEIKVEIGFIDGVPASNTSGVNNISTPTFYSADAALFHFNHTGSTTTCGFYTVGSTSNQPDAVTAITSTVSSSAWNRVRVQLFTNNAACWLNGQLVANHHTDANGYVEGGVALAPWVYVRANSATSKTLSVDQIEVWGDRPALAG